MAEEGDKPWYDGATPEQTQYIESKGWKGPLDVVGTAINAEKLIGAEKAGRTFVLPKDENDAEGMKAFRDKIGVPGKPEDYETPESMKEDPLWASAAKVAHEAGIPKGSFGKFINGVLKAAQDLHKTKGEKYQAETAAELEKLRGEWGKDFDANAEFARRFVKSIGWDDKKIALFEKTFGTATMLKDFHAFGSKTGEHGFKGGGDDTGNADALASVNRDIADLRQRRIEGKVDEATYLAEIDRLGTKRAALGSKAA